jgi:hypothetical protein
MKHSLLYVFAVLMFLTSCKSNKPVYYYSIEPELVSSRTEDNLAITELPYDDITIRTAFAGYGLDYAIFQIEVDNDSDYFISINYNDLKLVPTSGANIRAHNKFDFIKQLQRDKKEIKSNKKKSTVANILFGGLQALAFVGSGDGVGAIVYGADTAIFIAGDRKSYDLASGDVEREINYINEWVLFESIIESNSTFTTDVIFPNQDLTTDFDLVITLEGEEYRIPYDNVLRTAEQ